MSNEIKVGDTVRFNYDTTPRIYLIYSKIGIAATCVVDDIQDGNSVVKYDDSEQIKTLVIPTKYLVKVDAEAKEAKYHKDDKVCINKSSLKHGLRGEILTIIGVDVSDRTYYVQSRCMRSPIWLREDEISLYTEPTVPKFKVGDRIKFKNIYELQKVKDKSFRWMLVMFASKEATITAVEDNGFYRVDIDPSIGGINDDMIECKVEPTEQTEANIKTDEIDFSGADTPESIEGRIRRAAELTKTKGDTLTFPIVFDLSDGYWDAYAADLAKEVALKVANKYNGPKEAAEYAVSVAKAVVEGLKRK